MTWDWESPIMRLQTSMKFVAGCVGWMRLRRDCNDANSDHNRLDPEIKSFNTGKNISLCLVQF